MRPNPTQCENFLVGSGWAVFGQVILTTLFVAIAHTITVASEATFLDLGEANSLAATMDSPRIGQGHPGPCPRPMRAKNKEKKRINKFKKILKYYKKLSTSVPTMPRKMVGVYVNDFRPKLAEWS